MNFSITFLILVFVSGGIVCSIAQAIIDLTRLTPAKILVLYVCLGVFLFAVGLYDPLFSMVGAGVSVPLLGFGSNIAKGVKEAINKDGIVGILTGGLTACAGGITAAIFFGYLAALFSNSRDR